MIFMCFYMLFLHIQHLKKTKQNLQIPGSFHSYITFIILLHIYFVVLIHALIYIHLRMAHRISLVT